MRVSGRLVLKEESSYCFRPHSYGIHEEYYRLALCIMVHSPSAIQASPPPISPYYDEQYSTHPGHCLDVRASSQGHLPTICLDEHLLGLPR